MSKNASEPEQIVKLRKRKMNSGNTALFLDFPEGDSRKRVATGLVLLPGYSSKVKESNRRTLQEAEEMRLERRSRSLMVHSSKRTSV